MRADKDALFSDYINREPETVIPAKAGIQSLQLRENHWMPACAGMTRYKCFSLKTSCYGLKMF